ncbi:MAG: hypothetical protein HQL08_07845 [Nitrospirae bacterium]|nr:hypothetical protein [Nitrospirota bacterium]
MLQQYLGSMTGYAAKASRRYSISSIVRSGVFHPKLYLFFGREGQGFLIVGSGNLTASGHGSNQELWGAFHIDGPQDPKAPIFKNAWKYVQDLSSETSGMARKKIDWVKLHTPWLDEIPDITDYEGVMLTDDTQCFFLSNKTVNMLKSIHTLISKETVREITLISPFFDSDARILHELADIYPDAVMHAIVQPDSCSAAFGDIHLGRLTFHDWNTIPGIKCNRYLHAKLLHIRTDSREYCMFGSANMTAAALGTLTEIAKNEEICLFFRREQGNWLNDLGLQDKGQTILSSDIPVKIIIDHIDDALTEKTHLIRLRAIDKLGALLQVYIDMTVDVKNLILKLFDGWGNVSGMLGFDEVKYQEESGHYRLKATEVSDDVLYGQLFNGEDLAISNKQIVHDLVALSRTNPDPTTQKMEDVLDRIEFGDAALLDILSYLNPDDLIRKDDDEPGSRKILNDEVGSRDGFSGEVLGYDAFTKISPEHAIKGGFSHLYGTHRIERVLETLRTIFEKLKIQDIDISSEDEESDKEALESSKGRFDDERLLLKRVYHETPSSFISLQKTVMSFFDQYIKILEKHRKAKHKPNILDSAMFTIALHLLLDFFNKEILIKKRGDTAEEYIATLLSTDGNYFAKTDYCRIVVDIMGKFTFLLVNGVDDSNDEYVRKRIEKCKRMAYWHGVCCMAQLIPSRDAGVKNLFSLWRLELGLNLQHYFAPDNAFDATAAVQEIEHRTKIMTTGDRAILKANIMTFWLELVQQYKHLRSDSNKYETLSRIFCKLCGFAHIHKIAPANGKYAGDYKVYPARPGYPLSKETQDFEDGVAAFLAGMAKVINYGR